jgi:hypothetical protein
MQLLSFLFVLVAFTAPDYMNNITVSTFAVGLGHPIGLCRDGKYDIYYSVDQDGLLRKFHQNGTIKRFQDIGIYSEDCVVDDRHNIYIGIILITA